MLPLLATGYKHNVKSKESWPDTIAVSSKRSFVPALPHTWYNGHQVLADSWMAHLTACPNTWSAGSVTCRRWDELLRSPALNAFRRISSLSPNWCCKFLAQYLSSFWARSSAKVSLTAFSFSTPSLAAFFGGLTLGWFNGHQFFTTELFSCFLTFH